MCENRSFRDSNIDQMENRSGAVVVAQLEKWSLPTPEVCSLNQVIGKIIYRIFVYY